MRKTRIGITHGDTNSVGYEVILKALENPTLCEMYTPIVYGSPKLASYYRKSLEIETNLYTISSGDQAIEGKANLVETLKEEVKVDMGQATPESAQAALASLDNALEDWKDDSIDVLVTNEMSLPQIKLLKPDFTDEVAYIAQQTESEEEPLTVLIGQDTKIALYTEDIPLSQVADSISQEKVLSKLKQIAQMLSRDFLVSHPRIAVLALNPTPGKEEEEILNPAIEQANNEKICVYGPLAAEQVFGSNAYTHYDCILALYNEQGRTPFRALNPEGGIRYTAGLPIVHTRPDHGCEFQATGKNTSDPLGLLHAIYTAADIFRHREFYDESREDPLPKLYHEKKERDERKPFRPE